MPCCKRALWCPHTALLMSSLCHCQAAGSWALQARGPAMAAAWAPTGRVGQGTTCHHSWTHGPPVSQLGPAKFKKPTSSIPLPPPQPNKKLIISKGKTLNEEKRRLEVFPGRGSEMSSLLVLNESRTAELSSALLCLILPAPCYRLSQTALPHMLWKFRICASLLSKLYGYCLTN